MELLGEFEEALARQILRFCPVRVFFMFHDVRRLRFFRFEDCFPEKTPPQAAATNPRRPFGILKFSDFPSSQVPIVGSHV